MLLNSSTRATKLQYSQREYWVEVALRVDKNGTCTRRKWHLGWAKVALAHRKTAFLWFSRRTARAKRCCLLCFFLQNGCSGRGCLNNICIASYGVGAKFFTTNLMSVDLPQNTPKTRKPIAERTSHKWHGYTTRGCSSLCCTKQLLLLPRNARNAQNLRAEKGLPRMSTDGHRLGGYGIPAIPTLPNSVYSVNSVGEQRTITICVHPCHPWEKRYSRRTHGTHRTFLQRKDSHR